jgi:hypothetical protein
MKQRGGFDIIPLKNSAFKYTKDVKRVTWNKHTYPIGEYIIQLVQNIPWKDYSFEGKINFLNYTEDDDDNLIPEWIEHTIKTKPIDKFPYYFFGGCVYEILNNEFKQLGNSLHNYTDPTGDVDVRLCLPNIEIKEKVKDDYSDFMFEPDGKNNKGKDKFKMNAFVDNYTKWIFNNVKEQLNKIPKQLFEKIFADTIEFEYKDEAEGVFADLSYRIQNLWIIRTIVNGMIKIQMTVKYKGMTEPDHILEFVLPAQPNLDERPQDIYRIDSLDRFANKYIVIKDKIPIESFYELYMANVRAGKERLELLDDDELHHKFYNHIQRLLFLNHSIGKILNKPGESDNNKITLNDSNYSQLIYIILLRYINFLLENKDTICKFLYSNNPKLNDCNKQEVLKYLTDGVDKILFKPIGNNKGDRILYFPNKYTYTYGGKEVGISELFDILQGSKKGGKRKTMYKNKKIKHRTIKKRK